MRAALLFLVFAVPASAESFQTRIGPAVLETGVDPASAVSELFLLPLAVAFYLPHHGFERFPYEGDGYGRGERGWAASARGGALVARGRSGGRFDLQVRGSNRLGWDVGWSGFASPALKAGRGGDYVTAHITSNYVQTGRSFVELGLGIASLQDRRRVRTGPSASLALEAFPRHPWSLRARWQGAVAGRLGLHELSAGAAVNWRWVGAHAGVRAFLGAAGDAVGPEFGLSAWF